MADDTHMVDVPDILAQPRGILSDREGENPVFWDYHHVFVWYCSSDSHLGALLSTRDAACLWTATRAVGPLCVLLFGCEHICISVALGLPVVDAILSSAAMVRFP